MVGAVHELPLQKHAVTPFCDEYPHPLLSTLSQKSKGVAFAVA